MLKVDNFILQVIFLGYDYQSDTVCSTIARGDFLPMRFETIPQ